MQVLLGGLLAGFVFGVALQRAKVANYDAQASSMFFLNMRIFKFMLSAILMSAILFHIAYHFNAYSFKPQTFSVFGVVVGGLVFGAGWGLLGFCPATVFAGIGEGRIDGLFGLLGMIFGGMIYPVISEKMEVLYQKTILHINPIIYQLLGINPFVVLVLFAVFVIGVFVFFEKKGL